MINTLVLDFQPLSKHHETLNISETLNETLVWPYYAHFHKMVKYMLKILQQMLFFINRYMAIFKKKLKLSKWALNVPV